MSSLKMFAVIAVAVLFAAQADAAAHGGSMDFTVEVDRVSEFFLPTTVGGSPALDAGAGEQFDFDADAKIAYVVGETGVVNVVSYADPAAPVLLETIATTSTGTDIEFCGGVVAVGMEGVDNKQQLGKIAFYDAYVEGTGTVLKYEIDTGYLPDMIHFTKDCNKIVVANEGEAGVMADGALFNPKGTVGVVTWADNDKSQSPNYVDLDFAAFSGDDLYKPDGTGVLWSYRPDNQVADDGQSSFQQDLEPEYVAFNEDETKAYVILQENNAVAVVSLGDTPKIESVSGLGLKSWKDLSIDASNKDDAVNMVTGYDIYGAFQPDTIKGFKGKDGKDYMITANEGDAKEYLNADDSDFWLEEMRGADVAAEMTLSADIEGMRAQLEDTAALGRLKFLNRHGLDETGAVSKLIAMGARGVSIFDMSNDEATLAWDSGDEIEKLHADHDPDGSKGVFNPEHADSPDDLANCCFDGRSDDKGAETESIETGMCGGHKLLFVGNERSSTLVIYDITEFPSEDPKVLKFLPLANPDESTTETWQTLFDNGNIGMIDPESMKFIPVSDTEGHLMVAGSVSGNVGYYKVSCGAEAEGEGEGEGEAPPDDQGTVCSGAAKSVASFAFAVVAAVFAFMA